MKQGELSSVDHRSVEEIAAEILRAQEVMIPATVDELQQASEFACAAADVVLGNHDRLQAMKDDDEPPEEGAASTPFEIWIDGTLALHEMFFETEEGALGSQLIDLVSLDDEAFAERKDDARALLQHTGNIALELYPSIHRLVTLGFGADRRDVLEKLSAGDLLQQQRVHDIAMTPRRKSVIGLLRDLDDRFPEDERTNIWSLEVPPELPTTIVLSDPFQSGSRELEMYWQDRIKEKPRVNGKAATILMLSGDRTAHVVSDLENIVAHSSDQELQRAAQTIADWLYQKQLYYQDPDPRDFELYHLGMEGPEMLTNILASLDVVKHADPELFCDFAGINAVQGRRSPYFGSFLHKALYNTQRLFERASPDLDVMELKEMMTQLFTLDEYVEDYGTGISRESLRAMAMRDATYRAVGDAATPASQAQVLMMTAFPNSRMAMAKKVREQLEAARAASPENIMEELRRHSADIEHPLKLAEYIGLLPESAEHDVGVVQEMRKIFGDRPFSDVRRGLRAKTPEYLKPLYDRIPMIDETREGLGFALRLRIALRDAYAISRAGHTMFTFSEPAIKGAEQFLEKIVPWLLYTEDIDAIQDFFRVISERRFVARVSTQSRASLMKPEEPGTFVSRVEAVEGWGDEERAFFLGQALIKCATRKLTTDERYVTAIFNAIEKHRPDLALLSIIAHPQGREIAFTYFEKFCDMIPPDRMMEILKLNAGRVKEFLEQFEQIPTNLVKTYLAHLREELDVRPGDHGSNIPSVALSWRWEAGKANEEMIELLKQIHATIVTRKTPWTREIFVKATNSHGNEGCVSILIDAWEIWGDFSIMSPTPTEAGSHDCSAWKQIDAYDRHDPSIQPIKYTSAEIAEKIVQYFTGTIPATSFSQSLYPQVLRYIEQKRDKANPKVRRSY